MVVSIIINQKVLNALLTTEANERSKSAQDHRFNDWFSDLFSVR